MKPFFIIILLFVALTTAQACPICNSANGKQMRASLLGPDLGFNVAVTIIPFLVFALIVALIYTGGRFPFFTEQKPAV